MQRPKIEKQTYTPPDVAAYLGLSQSGAYNLFHAEGFPSFKIGSRLLVTKKAFEQWLEKQQEVSACN